MLKMLKVFPRLQAMHWKREHDWNHSLKLNGLQLFAVQFQEVEIGIGILRESHSLAGNKMNQTGPLLATVRHHPESDGDSSPDPCAEKKVLQNEKLTQQDFLTALPCASTQSLHLSVQPTESTFLVRMSHGKTVKRIYHVDWIQRHNQMQ